MSPASHPLVRAGLGVFCAWSVAVLGIVESGLGGRYSLHPDSAPDVSLVPELSLQSGVGGVAGFDQYASIVERPLFSEDRRPEPAEDAAADDAAGVVVSDLTVVVTSIVITGDKRIAIVTDPNTNRSQTVTLGASLEGDHAGWKLAELNPRSVVFEGASGGRSTLDLRVFDGQGGEPPTPMAQPASGGTSASSAALQAAQREGGEQNPEAQVIKEDDSPEARAEQIRRRIEERRRQMREDAERANAERGQ